MCCSAVGRGAGRRVIRWLEYPHELDRDGYGKGVYMVMVVACEY